MKHEASDQLVECLERLLATVQGNEDVDIFVDMVAEEYMMNLVRDAHIPLRYLSNLRDDIRVEILDLLRIRAYTYPSLKEYFLSLAEFSRRQA